MNVTEADAISGEEDTGQRSAELSWTNRRDLHVFKGSCGASVTCLFAQKIAWFECRDRGTGPGLAGSSEIYLKSNEIWALGTVDNTSLIAE
jgi:hypothetical protein